MVENPRNAPGRADATAKWHAPQHHEPRQCQFLKNISAISAGSSPSLCANPDVLALALDAEGRVPFGQFLAAFRTYDRRWAAVEEAHLHANLATSEKKRFEIADGSIRAVYRHSVELEAVAPPATPPNALFHGTSPEAAAAIRREGLRPMQWQYVHLSPNRTKATMVSRRKSATPVILVVSARAAHDAGIVFHCANDGIWTAHAVSADFIRDD